MDDVSGTDDDKGMVVGTGCDGGNADGQDFCKGRDVGSGRDMATVGRLSILSFRVVV